MSRRPNNSATAALKSSTIRDFSGGWNVVDNELTLDPKYAPVLDNLYRAQDGSLKVRPGTSLFATTSVPDDATAYTFGSVSATISTTNASPNVVITLGASSPVTFNLGQRITIAGLTSAYGGIAASNINGSRVVTAANHGTGVYTVVAGAAASSTTGPSALDTGATFSRADTVTTSPVIAMHYFDTYLVCVHKSGEISRVSSSGSVELIWDDDIAGRISGAPAGWTGDLTFASFAVFGGPASGSSSFSAAPKLLVCNGVDRSVVIDFAVNAASTLFTYYNDTTLTAVTDAANDSPAGAKYVAAMPGFCVMAGIPGYESVLAISDENTPYVWPDIAGGTAYGGSAIESYIDMARVININDPTIRGIARFRDKLVVAFDEAIALVSFAVVSGAASHSVTEIIDRQGCIAHKSMVAIGDDVFMADVVGVPSLKQALYTGGVRSERVSQLIDPEIQALIKDLTIGEAEDFIYALWNPIESQYMLFVPATMDAGLPTSYHVFVYTLIQSLRVRAWSRYKGWNFNTGCVSQVGRVFLSEGDEIFLLGTNFDLITADLIDSDAHGAEGTTIDFRWELPWADFDDRTSIKKTQYISLETEGTASFTVQMYTDGIRTDPQDDSIAPALSMGFVGGDSGGFGINPQVYGGGRRTDDERLWKWPCKFKIAKLVIFGSVLTSLNFISISLLYSKGGYRR